jgi:hypothetical protein
MVFASGALTFHGFSGISWPNDQAHLPGRDRNRPHGHSGRCKTQKTRPGQVQRRVRPDHLHFELP